MRPSPYQSLFQKCLLLSLSQNNPVILPALAKTSVFTISTLYNHGHMAVEVATKSDLSDGKTRIVFLSGDSSLLLLHT